MNSLRLYWRYIGISIRSQMQYRLSFIMSGLGLLVVTMCEFFGVWALFDRFGSLRGWHLPEVAMFFGLITVAFALAEAFGRGFDLFSGLVKSGNFDRLLLRPRSAAMQVASGILPLHRIGRLINGLIVLLWATAALDVVWTPGRIALLVFTIFGGMCMFMGLFVLQATMSFWTTETLEIMNTVTYGGTETAQYPLSIYRPWFRKFFTFVVPLASVSYFPALAILGRDDSALDSPRWFQCSAPLIGIIFMLISLQVWKFGVRHYRSTGS